MYVKTLLILATVVSTFYLTYFHITSFAVRCLDTAAMPWPCCALLLETMAQPFRVETRAAR